MGILTPPPPPPPLEPHFVPSCGGHGDGSDSDVVGHGDCDGGDHAHG